MRLARRTAFLASFSCALYAFPALALDPPPPAPPAPQADVCAQLGLSAPSAEKAAPQTVTETVATTTAKAKAAGATISKGSGSASATSNPSSKPQPGISASRCSIGISQAKSTRAVISQAMTARSTFEAAGKKYGIDWRMLAAITVRESQFRNIDELNKKGKGWGYFQLTNRPGVTYAQAHDLTFSAFYASKLLAGNRAELARKFPRFTSMQLLQATAASYNFGTDDISGNPDTIDVGSTGGNYGASILNLMGCFG